jgi:predicted ester cyclase
MSVEDNKAVVARWFSEFWGEHFNPDVIDELAAPDIKFSYSLHNPCRGREEVRAFAMAFRQAFPDLNFWGTAELLGEGDYVIGQWEGGGTHTGPAFSDLTVGSLPANSGVEMHFTGVTILKVENGQIVEEKGLDDGVTMLKQAGLIPRHSREAAGIVGAIRADSAAAVAPAFISRRSSRHDRGTVNGGIGCRAGRCQPVDVLRQATSQQPATDSVGRPTIMVSTHLSARVSVLAFGQGHGGPVVLAGVLPRWATDPRGANGPKPKSGGHVGSPRARRPSKTRGKSWRLSSGNPRRAGARYGRLLGRMG